MSSQLLTRSTLICRSAFAKPALFTAVRFNSSDVQKLNKEPIVSVENLSGAPESLLDRTVRIFRPTRTPVQQGKNGTKLWRIDFDILEDGNRWENPLMGWASSSDFQQALTMKFISKEDAIRFAEKQGWQYYVQEPKQSKFVKKAYGDNYKYSAGKLRMIKTK